MALPFHVGLLPGRRIRGSLALALLATLAACAGIEGPSGPGHRPLSAEEGRALVRRALPDSVRDRAGWSTDIYAAFAALGINPSHDNICAAVAVIEQESSFQADPAVPGLASIARKEMDRRREGAGIPKLALDAALALSSSNGRTYGERLDAVKTEQQLSELYEDFIGRVPFGKSLLADRNPVRTGGPMQVGIAFAEKQVQARPYPYRMTGSLRDEVFSRRGGLYFGIAHLLDYPLSIDQPIFRFADFNAGRYASRNAAFQQAVSVASARPLDFDGDLVPGDGSVGRTEAAVHALAPRLAMDDGAIRSALELEDRVELEKTRLYTRVFELAEQTGRRPLPRAIVPKIELHSPKFTRPLTTEWFAHRVDERYGRCLGRAAGRRAGP